MNRDNSKGFLGGDMREPRITSRHYINLFNLSKLLRETVGSQLVQTENMSILDLGCGEKPYQPFFNGKYSSYIGVDITSYSWADVLASSGNLPFKNGSFDLCLCTQVYEHLPRPRQTTREVCRVLKKKGILLLSTHAAFPVHDYPSDYWRWTDQGLKMMLNESFLNINVYDVMTPLETIIQLAVLYLPKGKLGSLCTMFSNEFARFLGNYRNEGLPRLIGSYLAVARK
jgi:SAM-dependent methyltransferase